MTLHIKFVDAQNLETTLSAEPLTHAELVEKFPFVAFKGYCAVWHFSLLGTDIFVTQEQATKFHLPGSALYVLRGLRRAGQASGTFLSRPWTFKEIRIGDFPLNPLTQGALANGIQCWSESPMLRKNDLLRPEHFHDRKIFGDETFYAYANKQGLMHSWSFSYTQLEQPSAELWALRSEDLPQSGNPFFGATDEDLFFTRFEFNLNTRTYAVSFDCQGASPAELRSPFDRDTPFLTLGAWVAPNEQCSYFPPLNLAVAAWRNLASCFSRLENPAIRSDVLRNSCFTPVVQGYTSWYLHYNKINEQILLEHVQDVAQKNELKIFQIDDGYQTQIGDWLQATTGFPNGIKKIAEECYRNALTPGIWIAPFIALENSQIFNEHPDWLLRDDSEKLILCGNHPLWGGKFYALDSENREFRSHLSQILDTLVLEHGFRFIKADFLYASSLVATQGLTRAQRASRAHKFLFEECVKRNATLLSCGAALSAAFERCHYSRIGPDVGESWENTEFVTLPSREKVSTRAAIVNTITRGALSRTSFGVDPDVYLLRSSSTTLSAQEKTLLCQVNYLFGDLIFTSDKTALWPEDMRLLQQKMQQLLAHRSQKQLRVHEVRLLEDNCYGVRLLNPDNAAQLICLVNLADDPVCLDKIGNIAPHSFKIIEKI